MKPTIEAAFAATPRRNFLPPELAHAATQNVALPIGYGQTNSQPETVQYMLKWLDVKPADKVLDVGSGSGWTSALLSYLVGPDGQVIAVEIIPELVKISRSNCAKLGIRNVKFHQAGATLGWQAEAMYDKILVSAATDHLPQSLLDQLRLGGRMVIPINQSIMIVDKDEQGNIEQVEKPGFVFVPLIDS